MYFKEMAMEINRNNYETFFLLYLDRELKPPEMQDVEKFLSENADLQKEFVLLQQTIFVPAEIIFDQKESLLRKEEKRRIVSIYWMRIAAAVALLILGSWLITIQVMKNRTDGILKSDEVKIVLPTKTNSSNLIKKEENSNTTDLSNAEGNKNQSDDQKNLSATQNKSTKNSGNANIGLKSRNDLPGKNNQDAQHPLQNPEKQNPPMNGVSDEPVIAVQKSSALELQSAEVLAGRDPKQIVTMPGTQAPVLLVASAKTTDPFKYENAVLKEPDYQTDNAISVVALNDNNKGITGFFRKFTKRTPEDENSRKVRVSVFQFSY
jgi:hypothetical protein